MIPLERYATVSGIPVRNLLNKDRLRKIIERTKHSGAEIVGLLKTGSAFHAPSAAAVYMVEAIVLERPKILPASVYLNGQYGIRGIYLGAPIQLGPAGVEKIYEVDLSREELAALKTSADMAKQTFKNLMTHEI
jgi:malate dehydrogenase